MNEPIEKLRVLAGVACGTGSCPTIYLNDNGDVIVQGYVQELATPDGEQAVRIPQQVLLAAAKAI